MANQPHPDDPYRSNPSDDDFRRQARLDNELQADPELTEGPASSTKMAMYAIAIAVVLGAVFYGLNNTSIHQASTSSTTENTSGPRTNTDQGTTTGAAPARPQSPPSPAPAGQDINRSGNPPANAPASK
jgi:hypothetical protein